MGRGRIKQKHVGKNEEAEAKMAIWARRRLVWKGVRMSELVYEREWNITNLSL